MILSTISANNHLVGLETAALHAVLIKHEHTLRQTNYKCITQHVIQQISASYPIQNIRHAQKPTWVEISRVNTVGLHSTRHIASHCGSFQADKCAGTDNQKQTNKIICATTIKPTKPSTSGQAMVEAYSYNPGAWHGVESTWWVIINAPVAFNSAT